MMTIQVTGEKSFVASSRISVVDPEGHNIDVVSLYGAVELDGMTSYNFTILNKEIYKANKEAIQDEVDRFVEAIKTKITELGGLQF